MHRLLRPHTINEAMTNFCSHKDSVVTLTVAPENEKYLFRAQYKIADAMMGAVREIIKRWLATGKIKRAPRTGFNSPLLAVPKKDDSGRMTGVRLCLDIRMLNKYLIEKDQYQLPRINEMLASLAGNQLFGEYDLSEAYFQFRLSEESQKYTAFTWESQQYVFVGCPFGIKHIPSLFQRFITNLFVDMPFVFPYIDNIAFASKTWEEHYEHAKAIVERLNSVNLRIKPSSYNLGNTQLNLLGHQISEKGIALDPEKKLMIRSWERPVTGERLQSALGLGAYLRDNIRHYADLAAPLEAVKKQKVIEWDDKLIRHWELWKRAFATAPILSFPDFNKRIVLATDASQTGIGGILYQPDDGDNTITANNIIAITSKQLNGSQRMYPTYKKELWGVVHCLRKFHSFLWGRRDVTVLTDHRPLIHILQQRNMTVALQQWVDIILDYDLEIKYRPGILHVVPDALSRMYEATYADPSITWGTQNNITFCDKFTDHSSDSPSDAMCIQSLAEIKPLSAVKKRHREGTERKGGSKVQRSEDVTDKKKKKSVRFASKDEVRAFSRNEDTDTVDLSVTDDEGEEQEEHHVLNDDVLPSIQTFSAHDIGEIPPEEEHEWDEAQDACALFAASDVYTEHIARLCAFRTSVSDQYVDDLVQWMADGAEATIPNPVVRALTQEQKLLVAQADRGLTIPDETKKQQLLEKAHAFGHFGEKAMYHHIQRQGWWWPKMREDIGRVIDGCNDCRKFTIVQHGFHPARSINATNPGDHYQIDLAQLPRSTSGRVYCLVLVDVCTGFIMLRPMKAKTAAATAHELWQIFSVIGIPRVLQSDNGTEFLNETVRALTHKLGVPHRFISEYNPRADGKVERVVRTVKTTVMKLLKGATVYWPLHLPFVQYAYNNKVQSLTGSTPFSLMFGRVPNSPINYQTEPETDRPVNLSAWRKHLDEVLSLILPAVHARVRDEQTVYRTRLDNIRRKLVTSPLRPGSKVELKDPKYLLSPKPAVEATYVGPYFVVRQNKYGAYVLKDQHGKQLDRTVPLDQIKVRDIVKGQAPPQSEAAHVAAAAPAASAESTDIAVVPGQDEDEQTKELDVDEVLAHREHKGQLEYQAKWAKSTKLAPSWEPEENFNDRAVIDRYWRKRGATAQVKSARAVRKHMRSGSLAWSASQRH